MTETPVLGSARLVELEDIVERGLSTFVEIGEALMEIRDSELYLESHPTFDAYCRERWQMQRAHAYRLIQSAGVVTALSPIGDTPANESQARELGPLLRIPEALRETWHEAVEKYGDPTALQVRGLVERRRAPAASPDPEALEARQRLLLINELDQAVTALEGMPSLAVAAANRILLGGGPGPFTPERLDRVAAYASAFADTLRRAA